MVKSPKKCSVIPVLMASSALIALVLSGCSAVDVYRADGTDVKGIPFVAKKVVTKQESVWQLNGISVTLRAVGEDGGKTNEIGTIMVPSTQFNTFKKLFAGQMTIGAINAKVADFINSRLSTKFDVSELWLISNRKTQATVFDDKIFYINATRPIVGSVGFTPEFNSDGMLTKVSATAEDKTIPTLLEPFKDALGAAAKVGLGVASAELYIVDFPKVEQKAIASITVTKELQPGEKIGKPILPPGVFSQVETDSPFDGIEVVVSFPDDKKTTDDKPAFKFSGSVTPPK